MNFAEQGGHYLTYDEACAIQLKTERVFALLCISVGCMVQHQVKVGESVIDFLVVNPKIADTKGTLVEVTLFSKDDLDKRKIRKNHSGKRKVANKTAERKKRQIMAMENSGQRWVILYKHTMMALTGKN